MQRPETLQPTNRVDTFTALVSDTFFPMAVQARRDSAGCFTGALHRRQLGKVGFAKVGSSPLDVYRDRQHIGRASDAAYLVKVQVQGEGLVRHRGREALLRPGDFTLCLSSEPYELHFPQAYSQVVLAVPEPLMEECVPEPARHLGVRMASNVGANGLFSQFVSSIASRLDSLDGVLARRLEANVIDLLSTTLGYARESQRQELLASGVKQEYLQRIKQFIRRHLGDERLGPEWIAEAHGITARYLHRLFEHECESVSRYIQRLRLEACRDALSDDAFAAYPVSEIAYRAGFKDASHFSRAFKKEFGLTPARYRRDH